MTVGRVGRPESLAGVADYPKANHASRRLRACRRGAGMTIRTDLAYAQDMDDRDELREFRQRFLIDEPRLIYVDGNSLGRLPRESLTLGKDLISRQWGSRLIRAWNESWFRLPEQVGAKIARLIGAGVD